jgi:hypothetical protein
VSRVGSPFSRRYALSAWVVLYSSKLLHRSSNLPSDDVTAPVVPGLFWPMSIPSAAFAAWFISWFRIASEVVAWEPLGSVGIPTTRLPGIAANFGEEGVIYVLRVPRDLAITPIGWGGLQLENEFVILNSMPAGSIVKVIPASRIPPLIVDDAGLLMLGGGPP